MTKIKKTKAIITILILFLFINTNYSYANNISIFVNNIKITPDIQPYIVDNLTYVPIRFISETLNAKSIEWNNKTKEVTLTIDNKSMVLKVNSNKVILNNQEYVLTSPIQARGGRTFVPLRFVSEKLGYSVDWDHKTNSINIKSYTAQDLYWLSRIIEAESKGEPYNGKLAVANVIINRKKHPSFPNTIKDVIFDRKHGIQFSPIVNGAIYNTPSIDSINAAIAALEGNNNVGGCLYFFNPSIAKNSWIARNRTFYIRIKNHSFYI